MNEMLELSNKMEKEFEGDMRNFDKTLNTINKEYNKLEKEMKKNDKKLSKLKSVEETKKEYENSTNEYEKSIDKRDKQIEKIITTQKETLADRINQKYKFYLSKNGIPEDEVDEFISLHAAYKSVGGNHSGDAKFNYCMDHLPLIPVDVKLKYDD